MKVLVFGGTRFIGRATVEDLVSSGHEVMVSHRGETEPEDFPDVVHLHVARADLSTAQTTIEDFAPDAVLDTLAMTRTGATQVLSVVPSGPRIVVLSSCDVYRAYAGVMAVTPTDAVPVFEDSPVRAERYPYKGREGPDWLDEYDKLDVEEVFLDRGAVVLRLPMVYGERDGQRREEFILRRVRAGRERIPFGAGTWLSSRGYVRDIASGIRLALETPEIEGEVFNLAESSTATARIWAEMILEAAGHKAELVRVSDDKLPADLGQTAALPQHLLVDASKARSRLRWKDGDSFESLRHSVEWHLANPPEDPSDDFTADDEALSAV